MTEKIGRNFKLAYLYSKKIIEKKALLFIENPAFNPETGEQNLLDVFVCDKRYDVLDWLYALADPEDEELGISKYNFEWILSFTDKYFSGYSKFIISEEEKKYKDIRWLNIKDIGDQQFKGHNILSIFFETDEKRKKKVFDIYLLKVQQFLNFMDTDSIPLYFKNIAVLENELGNHKRALFDIKLALKKNKGQEILDELLITLLKLGKFPLLNKITGDDPDTIVELQTRAFSMKMTGNLETSLILYEKLYMEKKEDWVKNDIRWLKDELTKRS